MVSGRGSKVAGWALGLVGLGAGLMTAACGTAGERASSGGCPAGEVCSDATPEGLRFYGASLAGSLDVGTNPLVLGGRETITWRDVRGSHLVLPQHMLVSSDEGVLRVTGQVHGGADLAAGAEGTSLLRVLDAEGRLMDRVSMSARPLAGASLVAVDAGFTDALTSTHREPAFAPGTHQLGVALLDASGHRLVDEGLSITADVPLTRRSWDLVDATLAAADATLRATVSAGQSVEVRVRAAGPIDGLDLLDALLPTDASDHVRVGAGDLVCVRPTSGEFAVIGGEFMPSFVVDGAPVPPSMTVGCVALPSGLGATVEVVASVGSVSRGFTFDVDPARATSSSSSGALGAASFAFPVRRPVALGDRARLALDPSR